MQSKGLSRVFFNTIFKSINSSVTNCIQTFPLSQIILLPPLHSPHHGMPRSTLLIHSLMSSFLLSQGTFFEFSHLFTLSTDSLIDSVNKHIQYSAEYSGPPEYSGPGLLSLQGRAMPRSQFTPVKPVLEKPSITLGELENSGLLCRWAQRS